MNIAIVLAGGVGARVGADIPKQFIKVLGKPIMIYTLETFQKCTNVDKIVLVGVESHLDLAKEYCEKYNLSKVTRFVKGGEEFIDSCINGMNSLAYDCNDEDIVLITSADRPFISEEEIDDAIRVCTEKGSGVAARPCSLCMFKVDTDCSSSNEYLRNELMQTATPWAFKYSKLMTALEMYNKKLITSEPYPVAIYASAGNRIYFSKAKPENIKITESYDVALMEHMLTYMKGEGNGTKAF